MLPIADLACAAVLRSWCTRNLPGACTAVYEGGRGCSYSSGAMLPRKQLPSELAPCFATFRVQAERVESARQALLSCLPVGRVDPVPVPVGLDLIVDELRAVAAELGDWRSEPVEEVWELCRSSMDESLAAVPDARRVAEETSELEELLEAVGDVVEPLDAWHTAERRWLSLRTRRR